MKRKKTCTLQNKCEFCFQILKPQLVESIDAGHMNPEDKLYMYEYILIPAHHEDHISNCLS